jgi:spore germination protein GerM
MKKSAKRQNGKNSYIIPLFWVMFVAVVILLFIICMPKIRETINATHLGERITGLPLVPDETAAKDGPVERIAPEIKEEDYPSLEDALVHLNDAIMNAEKRADSAVITEPDAGTGKNGETGAEAKTGTQERFVYFMRVDADGILVRTQERRQIKNSVSPLLDTINVLLAGVAAAEEARGMTTLIPEGTVLINAAMRGSTAVLNFNENFMFNSYGAEGYLAQLRQIVWTATEFSGVNNVQFLIEGQRINFLGDNIRLDLPISREDVGQL